MKLKIILSFIVAVTFSIGSLSQVAFTADVTGGCAPLNVNFTNLSDISVVHCDWYYGDGFADFDTYNVSHTFTSEGNFTVEMYGYDATYTFVGSYTVNINVEGPPSYISMSNTPVCVGDIVELSTYYSSPSYNWNFGDGNTQSTSSPYGSNIYSSPGTYPVTMEVFTPSCGSYIVNGSIDVVTSAPYFYSYVYMGVSPTIVCPTGNVSMYCSQGFQSYNWDFDNGLNGSSTNESTTYGSVGNYNPSVTITNGCGNDTTLFSPVTVDNTLLVDPITTYGPTEICLSEEIQLDAYCSNGSTYVWDFGDGSPTSNGNNAFHTYATAGTYVATVTVTNECGNFDTQNHVVIVSATAPVNNPFLQINPTVVCPNDEITYSVPYNYDYYIDFGDGFGESSGYSHTFSSPGVYPVTVILQNACGSTASVTEYVSVQTNVPISSNVDIYIYENPSCPNTDINFSSAPGFSNYHWTFGDGTFSNYHQVNHPYVNAGNYPISLTITNGCGNDTTLYSVAQVANNLPVSYLDYAVFGTAICTNDILYMSTEQGNELNYVWDFGDGNTSTDAYASHVYGVDGTYTITLTATNGCGNDTTVSQVVTVGNNVPINSAMMDFEIQTPGCIGDNLYFAVVPAGIGTYAWNFGDGNTGFSDELLFINEQPIAVGTHSYNAPGTYNAQLTVTNGCGNTFDTTIVVTIGSTGDNVPVELSFWQNEFEPTCQGLPVVFQAVGAGTYIWNFGDGSGNLVTYNSFEEVSHVYQDHGYFNLTVTGYNQCGNSDVGSETIYVPDSKITVVTNAVQNSNCGEENGVAIVSATGGAQPYIYSWTNGDNTVIADSLGSGIYSVSVTDNNGCHSEGLAAVSENQGPVIILDNIQHNTCYGQQNGVIAVSILGGAPPYQISWSNGSVTEDIFNLVAGPYEIFVTDANGCFAAKSFTVNQPQQSIVSVLTAPADCGGFNGTATAAIGNGVGPFNYIWPNGASASNQTSGLAPGIHTLLVIDGNTCLLTKEFVVNETNAAIIVVDSIVEASCAGILNAVYINTIAGVSPFTYTWSNGSTNQDLINVVPGHYTVQVEGGNGCSSFMIFDLEMESPDKPGICIVTVDTLTNSNLVVWTADPSPDVVSYNIYKESSLNGLYYLVANQSASLISQYYDYLSNPAIKSWRYKVTAVDNCGNESAYSDPHKTIHLTSNLGVSGVVNLIWDHYNGFNYSTYYINRYHPSTGWMVIDSVGASAISYTDLTPPSDSNLVYMIGIYPPSVCTASKAQDHNSSRSNKSGINYVDPNANSIDEATANTINIYPNPTNGLVNFSCTTEILNVRVYDLSGKLVYQVVDNNSTMLELDFFMFSDGIYTAEIETSDGLLRTKIVKQ